MLVGKSRLLLDMIGLSQHLDDLAQFVECGAGRDS